MKKLESKQKERDFRQHFSSFCESWSNEGDHVTLYNRYVRSHRKHTADDFVYDPLPVEDVALRLLKFWEKQKNVSSPIL